MNGISLNQPTIPFVVLALIAVPSQYGCPYVRPCFCFVYHRYLNDAVLQLLRMLARLPSMADLDDEHELTPYLPMNQCGSRCSAMIMFFALVTIENS